MLKGFMGDYYNGIPIFIREEYEEANSLYYEYERIGDYFDCYYDSVVVALNDIENKEPRLLYRVKSKFLDDKLRGYKPIRDMWKEYKKGYVHEITGEYVISSTKPNYDSYPFWVKVTHPNTHKSNKELIIENATAGAIVAIQMLNGLDCEIENNNEVVIKKCKNAFSNLYMRIIKKENSNE